SLLEVSGATSDLWAVGNSPKGAFIEHWDGTRWTIANAPAHSPDTTLTGVAWLSATSAWAVGTEDVQPSLATTFVEHWDGVRWTSVHSANPGDRAVLNGIA